MTVSLYAGLLALFYIALSFYVIAARYKTHFALGDGEDFELKRRIRAHANFAEYTPLFLVLIAIAEHGGLATAYIHALCILFLFGRLCHAYSLLKHEKYSDNQGRLAATPKWRPVGMVSTFMSIIITALALVAQGL